MIDIVVRPLAGLLLCIAFGAALFALPTLITRARGWISQLREAAPTSTLGQITPKPDEEKSEADRKAS